MLKISRYIFKKIDKLHFYRLKIDLPKSHNIVSLLYLGFKYSLKHAWLSMKILLKNIMYIRVTRNKKIDNFTLTTMT